MTSSVVHVQRSAEKIADVVQGGAGHVRLPVRRTGRAIPFEEIIPNVRIAVDERLPFG